jgi:hypothetical protein
MSIKHQTCIFQPYLCESFYVLLEYARTAMFHWFFIEGLHLHNVLTIDVFPSHHVSVHRYQDIRAEKVDRSTILFYILKKWRPIS